MKVVLLSRKKRISTRYLELRSMQLVAKEFNLSRERIRQICIIELGQDKIDKIKKQNKKNTAERNKNEYIKKYGIKKYKLRKKYYNEYKSGNRWTILYDSCLICKRKDKPHYSKGLCELCYSRARYKDPDYRKKHSEYQKKWYMKNKAKKE